MSKSERNFIESELAEDIAYFHNIFRDWSFSVTAD
jgi:hypothetical protein